MRAAPAVAAPVDGCWPERVLITLLYAATGGLLGTWAAAHGALPGEVDLAAWAAVGAAVGLLAGLPVANWVLPDDVSQLAWDGRKWSVSLRASVAVLAHTPAAPVAADAIALDCVAVALDLGPWLLLRLRPGAGRPRWLVLRERRVGATWHLLRVALRAHGRWQR